MRVRKSDYWLEAGFLHTAKESLQPSRKTMIRTDQAPDAAGNSFGENSFLMKKLRQTKLLPFQTISLQQKVKHLQRRQYKEKRQQCVPSKTLPASTLCKAKPHLRSEL